MLNQPNYNITLDEPSPNDIVYYRTDPERPIPFEEHGLVEVNDVESLFTEGQFEEFQRVVDPLVESDRFGTDICCPIYLC